MGLVKDDGTLVEQLYYNSTGLCKSWDPSGGGSWNTHPDNAAYNLGRSEYIPFGYLGMYRDRFTGKYHTHFREYDPLHARWLSEDPAGYADGLNLYNAYMGVNGIDPFGLETPWRKKANSITSEYKRFVEAREAYLNGGGSLESIYKDKFGDYPEYYYTGKQTATAYDPDIHTSWDGALVSHSDYAQISANFGQSQSWWEENPTLHSAMHIGLDILGALDPIPGQPVDSFNALTYALHGESRDAYITISAAAAGFLLGDLMKGSKYVDEVSDYAKMLDNTKGVDNVAPKGFNRVESVKGFQSHHIISNKNILTKNHELLELAGFDLNSSKNLIYLPTDELLHPTRSIHLGRHRNSISRNMEKQMDAIVRIGSQQGWSKQQYNQALVELLSQERQILKSGNRALNKNARPWAK